MEPLKGGQLANPPSDAKAIMNKAPVSRSPVDWALQFLWNRPEVACVLSGMGNRKMVEENCTSADTSGVNILSPAEIEIIEELAEVYRRKIIVPCTSCRYCMPCPSGVNIPQNFALLNNKSINATKLMSKAIQWMIIRNYNQLAKNDKQLLTKKNNGRASLCSKCNACISKCPQQIRIPSELEKVTAAFEKRIAKLK
jgi:predicted aldo/keto reductase-like oxidoreductase